MIQVLQSLDPKIWIDQICINQADLDEKATQISLMQHIYAHDDKVVIWPGRVHPTIELFVDSHPILSRLAEEWTHRPWTHDSRWDGYYWPNDDDPVWVGICHLLNNARFRRLWTYQEIVLAKEAVFIIQSDATAQGPACIGAIDLFLFVARGHYARHDNPTNRGYLHYNEAAAQCLPGKPARTRLAFKACETIMKGREDRTYTSSAIQPTGLVILIDDLRFLDVKERVDRVWAMMGLMSQEMQQKLAPLVDYSDTGRREYWRTYVSFARLLINDGQRLELLASPPSRYRSEQLPSWCPDFSQKPANRMHLWGDWNRAIVPADFDKFAAPGSSTMIDEDASNRRYSNIVFHLDKKVCVDHHDNLLNAYGYSMDTISEVVGYPYPITDLERPLTSLPLCQWLAADPMRSKIEGFFRDSLSLAKGVLNNPDTSPHIIPTEYLMAFFADSRVRDTTGYGYREAWMCLATGGFSYFLALGPGVQSLVNRYLTWFWKLLGHSFFVTKAGRLGLAAAGCAPGDRVCTLYGGEPLYVLRGRGTKSEPAEYVVLAFVPHIMEQHQRDAARVEDGRIIVIA
jgi:hypothetical protein